MFEGLDDGLQDVAGFVARLPQKAVRNLKEPRKAVLDDSIEVLTMVPRLEAVDSTYRQQTLRSSVQGCGIRAIQQMTTVIDIVRPSPWEVMVENLLKYG